MIDVLGLKEGKSYDLINEIWEKKHLDKVLSKKTKKEILDIADGNEFKPVNPLLEPLIGVYPLGIYKFPDWWNKFKIEYVNFITDYMKEEIIDDYNKEEIELKETKKLIETIELLGDMTPQLLKEGKLPNGEKIIKRLKKTAELVINYEEDILSAYWNRIYETNKTSTVEENVVITNSIASTIGMSSYFENPDHSSCMTIMKNSNASSYAKGIWSNILDRNSLIIYVTNGSERGFYGEDAFDNKYTHQAMTTRYVLRLIQTGDMDVCNNCGAIKKNTSNNKSYCSACKQVTNTTHINNTQRIGVVLDRAYPHNAYTYNILKLLNKLCKINNLDLFYYDNYNDTQTTNEMDDRGLELTSKKYRALDVEPVLYTMLKDYDSICQECEHYIESISCNICKPCSTNICNNCKLKNSKISICSLCRDGRKYCKNPENVATKAYADNAVRGGSGFTYYNAYDEEHYRMQYNVKLVKEVN